MKNIKKITLLITILIIVTSCGKDSSSAKNDFGDSNKYIEYQQNQQDSKSTEQSTKNDITVSSDELTTQEVISEGGPVIEFSNNVWDFGNIQQGESVDYVFQFINTGSEPLIISNAKGSCGCTVPEWPKEAIPPNGMGEIAVQFNSGEKKGRQNKTVTLTTNCTPNQTTLRVVGNILTE